MALAFFVSGIVYMYFGRWRVTHMDYWNIYDVCLNDTWLKSALIKYGGHSLFFPMFLQLANLRFFHGSQQLLFLAGFILLLISVSLLLIPVWRDQTVSLTAKIMSTLVVVLGSFWMGRAAITTSGGFNCENSSVMVGTTVAFLLLQKISQDPARLLPTALIVLCAGFVASFSMAIGLAIWPTLLFLAWRLRLPRHFMVMLALAGIAAAVAFVLLPPSPYDSNSVQGVRWAVPSGVLTTVVWLSRLIGSPVSYAVFAWWPDKSFQHLIESSGLALWSGAVGLALAASAALAQLKQQKTKESTLRFTGLALVIFTIFGLLLVVGGRSNDFSVSLTAAPRYLFWSTLFWTGLFLIAIQRADSRPWLRLLVYFGVLALPILMFPEHYKTGVARRWGMSLAESAAMSLVNEAKDQGITKILFRDPSHIYRVAEQLRARRLDMFADGLQDWIGLSETNLFGGRHQPERLRGDCSVTVVVQGDDGLEAARVIGQASTKGNSIPKRLVIVDPTGVVRGVARSSTISPIINRVFYLGKFGKFSRNGLATGNGFVGYIHDYNPQLQYAVRSADHGILSEEKILVRALTTPTKL